MTKPLIILALLFSFHAFAANESSEAIPVCSLLYVKAVKKKAESHGDLDKYKHCAVSCMLALRCPAYDVLEIGILKELADIVGPGNAELNDFKANYEGVNLVTSKKSRTDESCIKECKKIYPCP